MKKKKDQKIKSAKKQKKTMADDEEHEKRHSQVMTEIDDQGHIEDNTAAAKIVTDQPVKAHIAKSKTPTKPGVFEFAKGEDGTLSEQWDPYLPRPPSMSNLKEEDRSNSEQVAVFNANTQEGSTIVRVLSEKGLRVVAAVRVFTSKNTKALIKLKGVTVKVADWNDEQSLLTVAKDCTRAFVVTKYWEKFDSKLEETMASNILESCATVNPPIKTLVLATFEDASALKARGKKSQIVPTRDGRIFPNFDGKSRLDDKARKLGVQLTHMMTSYQDSKECKRSLILIRGLNKRIVVNSYVQDEDEKKDQN